MSQSPSSSRPTSQILDVVHENLVHPFVRVNNSDVSNFRRTTFGSRKTSNQGSTVQDADERDRITRRTPHRSTSITQESSQQEPTSSSRSNTDNSEETAQQNMPNTSLRRDSRTIEQHEGHTTARITKDFEDAEIVSVGGRSETTVITRKDLDTFDVAALIINKQIGTGIFTTPGLVLSLTGSKTVSLIMWACGGLWAFLSVIIYVEFGSAFPFNGGELIYLDEVFRRPELLATMLFSAFFITVPNTDGNSLQFAKHVLLAAEPGVVNTAELDRRLLTYIAISILTLVCFIHYFSRNSGLFLNLLFAVFKILLLIAFIIAGCIAIEKPDNGMSDWGPQPVPKKNALAGMIYIIYSYQGWENANYVGGELKVAKRDLKRGAFLAVGLITVLYTLITMAFCFTLPFEELAGSDLAIIVRFVPKAFGHSGILGAKICIALSAFGNLIAVVYTSAKVKQQIARQCVIPFYKFFAAEDEHLKTPYGAIILHWIFAVLWIICTPNTSDGYGFVIGLFIYGQLVVGFFVAIAFFFIRQNFEAGITRNDNFTKEPEKWQPVILKNRTIQIICGIIFMGMNMMVLVEGARSIGDPPSWVRPVVILGLLVVVFFLWAILRLIANHSNENSSVEIRIVRDGIDSPTKDVPLLQQAKLEGNSRVVVYETHGRLKLCIEKMELYLYTVLRKLSR